MKTRALLMGGLLLVLGGFTLQAFAEDWSTFVVRQGPMTGNPWVDENWEKAYRFTGEELSVLGIVFISLAAFTWVRSSE